MDDAKSVRPWTRQDLVRDLAALGLAAGDSVFVHSSFKSLGPVDGSADTVVAALEDAVGPAGGVLMPSFNLKERGNEARAAVWNVVTTPSTVGWLTEFFRLLPGTVRSDHFSHSVAARGRDAFWYVSGHRAQEGMRSPWDMAPWGATFGEHSPFLRLYRDPRARILMLGVDYHSSTFCHLVEVMDWNRRLADNPGAEYYWINREKAGEHWDRLGRQNRGRIGSADCRLFGVRDFVDTVAAMAASDPASVFKWYPPPVPPPGAPQAG